MEKNFQLNDGSNDRSYFTIVPNYVLNHSTAIAQSLYLQLKRLAGENGIAYPSRQYLMDKLGISHPTLRKEFNYLLEKGWIESVGLVDYNTAGGTQKMKAYRIIDLWQINTEHYRGGKNQTTPLARGGKNQTLEGGKTRPPNKNHNKEELNTAETSSALSPFILEEYLEKMKVDKNNHVRLISYFITRKELTPSSVAEIGEIIRRNSKIAKRIADTYTKGKVAKAFDICVEKHSDIDWGLETVYKKLTNSNL